MAGPGLGLRLISQPQPGPKSKSCWGCAHPEATELAPWAPWNRSVGTAVASHIWLEKFKLIKMKLNTQPQPGRCGSGLSRDPEAARRALSGSGSPGTEPAGYTQRRLPLGDARLSDPNPNPEKC